MMLTTGMAWLISLVFFILAPDHHLNPIWDAGEKLLPSLAFSLDWVSSSYFLAVTSLIFFGILVEGFSPQTSAWITGLGGICVIGVFVDSAYALALVWTVIEALALYSYLKNQGEMEGNQRYILAILVRLTAPLLIIYVSMINSETGIAPFLTELPPSAAPYLLSAGMISFSGWSLASGRFHKDQPVFQPGKYASWTPAVLGLMLITRAAQIFITDEISDTVFLAGSILIFLLILSSALFSQPERTWRVGSLALLVGGFAFAAPQAILALGVVFILPGIMLFRNFESKRTSTLALILGGIGILPLPFFPAWMGLISFDGISGLFFSISAGIILGKTLNHGIQEWQKKEKESQPISPLMITGYAVVLISQIVISIQAGLIKDSLALAAAPVSAWIGALVFITAALFWNRIPTLDRSRWEGIITRFRNFLENAADPIPRITDGAVYLITRLFEGDGGLIWTLLFGFLIISLISLRGG